MQLPTSEVCVVFLCVFLMCSLKIVRENLWETLYHMQSYRVSISLNTVHVYIFTTDMYK